MALGAKPPKPTPVHASGYNTGHRHNVSGWPNKKHSTRKLNISMSQNSKMHQKVSLNKINTVTRASKRTAKSLDSAKQYCTTMRKRKFGNKVGSSIRRSFGVDTLVGLLVVSSLRR